MNLERFFQKQAYWTPNVHFLWKVYSISSDFAWSSLNIKYCTNRVEIYVFKKKIESCAQKLVWIFLNYCQKLHVSILSLWYFLLKYIFGKGPKLGLCSRKLWKFGVFDTFVVNSMNFIPLFSQIAFWIPHWLNAQVNGSFILQKLSWFEQKLGTICQKTCFFVVSWVLGVRPIQAKNCS